MGNSRSISRRSSVKPSAIKRSELNLSEARSLGSGACGVTYATTLRGQPVAVKVLELDPKRVTPDQKILMLEEAEQHKRLSHSNIVKLETVCAEENSSKAFLVMELLQCDLRQAIERANRSGWLWGGGGGGRKPFSLEASVELIRQVAAGMDYLHRNDICHRDLKSVNILLTSADVENGPFTAKLCDFGGRAKSLREDGGQMCSQVGTPLWMAPEVEAGSEYTPKADVFSFGMVCYEILSGRLPYQEYGFSRDRLPRLPSDSPEGIKELVDRCWARDPEARPDSREIVHSLQVVQI